jgi:Rubrerythrin.
LKRLSLERLKIASQAKKGYEQISGIFSETAENEKEHAKRLFKFLEGERRKSPHPSRPA